MLRVGMPIVANDQCQFFTVISVIMLNVIILIVLVPLGHTNGQEMSLHFNIESQEIPSMVSNISYRIPVKFKRTIIILNQASGGLNIFITLRYTIPRSECIQHIGIQCINEKHDTQQHNGA